MIEQPFAWLWQNAAILEDGCFNFYSSLERTEAEIRLCGGWSTPVYDEGASVARPAAINAVWKLLARHEPGAAVTLPPEMSAAIRAYLASDDYLASEAAQLTFRVRPW